MFFKQNATLNLVSFIDKKFVMSFDEVGVGGTSYFSSKNRKISATEFEFNTNNNASVIVMFENYKLLLVNIIYAVESGNVHNTPVTKGKFYSVTPSVADGVTPPVTEIELGKVVYSTLNGGLFFGISEKLASNGYSCVNGNSVYNLNISATKDTAPVASREVDAKAELTQDGSIDVAVSATGKFTSYCC